MNKIYNPKKEDWKAILKRPTQSVADIEDTVNGIFKEVAEGGDVVVNTYTKEFDKVSINSLLVLNEEIQEAKILVSDDLKKAIAVAKRNIEKFHIAQKTDKIEVETSPGVKCWQEKRPIQKVGLYIPGGTAPLFSTILMLAVPAILLVVRRLFYVLLQIVKEKFILLFYILQPYAESPKYSKPVEYKP